MYTFDVQLPPSIPGSYFVDSFDSGDVHDLTAVIRYKLKEKIKVNGFFVSKTRTSQSYAVLTRANAELPLDWTKIFVGSQHEALSRHSIETQHLVHELQSVSGSHSP